MGQNQDIKNAGLKVTLPRIKILQLLEAAETRHLSAEEVHRLLKESGDDVGIATVYRVLTQFENAGLVLRHNFDGGQAVFEMDRGGHHDHMMCLDCGAVEEFSDQIIEDQQDKIAKQLGFELTNHNLYLYGRCLKTNCPNKIKSSSGA